MKKASWHHVELISSKEDYETLVKLTNTLYCLDIRSVLDAEERLSTAERPYWVDCGSCGETLAECYCERLERRRCLQEDFWQDR